MNIDDDFFEMVSRAQSKRLNDQRCDPIILSDLTNHSKTVARQSDTIVCNSGKCVLCIIFAKVKKLYCRASVQKLSSEHALHPRESFGAFSGLVFLHAR